MLNQCYYQFTLKYKFMNLKYSIYLKNLIYLHIIYFMSVSKTMRKTLFGLSILALNLTSQIFVSSTLICMKNKFTSLFSLHIFTRNCKHIQNNRCNFKTENTSWYLSTPSKISSQIYLILFDNYLSWITYHIGKKL